MIVLSHFLFLCTFTMCANAPAPSVQSTEWIKTDDELADEEVERIMSRAMRQASVGEYNQYAVCDMAKPSTSKDKHGTAKPSTSKDTSDIPEYYSPGSTFDMNKPPPTPGSTLDMEKLSASKSKYGMEKPPTPGDTFDMEEYYSPGSTFDMNKPPPTPGGTLYMEETPKTRDSYGPIGPTRSKGAYGTVEPSTLYQHDHVTFAAVSKPYITCVPIRPQQHSTTHVKPEHVPQFNQQGVNHPHPCRTSSDPPYQQYQYTSAYLQNTNEPSYKKKKI